MVDEEARKYYDIMIKILYDKEYILARKESVEKSKEIYTKLFYQHIKDGETDEG